MTYHDVCEYDRVYHDNKKKIFFLETSNKDKKISIKEKM